MPSNTDHTPAEDGSEASSYIYGSSVLNKRHQSVYKSDIGRVQTVTFLNILAFYLVIAVIIASSVYLRWSNGQVN